MVLARPSHSSDTAVAAAVGLAAGVGASGSLPARGGIAQARELGARRFATAFVASPPYGPAVLVHRGSV